MTTIRTNTIAASSGSVIQQAPGSTLYVPGRIIQVQHTYYSTETTQSIPTYVWTPITGMSVTITPKSVTSKIYLTGRMFLEWGTTSGAWDSCWGFTRVIKNGPTINPIGLGYQPQDLPIGIHFSLLSYAGTDANSTPEGTFYDHVDMPVTTDPVTYSIATYAGAYTLYINRVVGAAATNYERGTSSITAMEIAA